MNKDQFKKNGTTIGGGGQDGDVWSPGFDENKMPRMEATEHDYRIGYYVGHKEGVGKNNSEVHIFQEQDGTKFQLWGTRVLDDRLKQVRDKFGFGHLVMVEWKGRVINKNVKEEYEKTPVAHRPIKFPWNTSFWQNWEVVVDEKSAPITVKGADVYTPKAQNTAPSTAPAPVTEFASDLPPSLDFQDSTEDAPY